MSKQKKIGTLVVVVLKARNLHDKHSLYKQDAFAQVSLNGKTKRTSVDVRGGQHPVWDEELRFSVLEVSSEPHRMLKLSCWAKEMRDDEVIGKGKVDITETIRTGQFDDWVQLEIDGLYHGEIYLEMTFFASGPALLQRRPSKLPADERLARPAQPYVYPQTPPKTPPKSSSPFRSRPSSAHHGQQSATATSASGSHLSPPSATIPASTRTSPRARHDVLPPLPDEAHLSPQNIPAILRPGDPRSDPHHTDIPLLPDQPVHIHYQASPPRSPGRTAIPLPGRSPPSSGPAFVPPPSLRPGASEDTRSSVQHNRNLLAPEDPAHTRLPSSPHSSPRGAGAAYAPPATLRPDPCGDSAHSRLSSSPHSTPVPALPPLPQPSAGAAYAPPSTLPARGHGETRPYPYNHAPTPPDPTKPHPSITAHYALSFPLPDEPAGVETPTPSHPQPHLAPAGSTKPLRIHKAPSKNPDQEERDRLLAVAIEREEEDWRRELAEREQHDRELAERLDMELNIEQDESPSGLNPALARNGSNVSAPHIPGGW
ncbi:hypothetical protein AcV5_008627 [Taiwanofungus camphoratus]|nr:hypothetical protein AcV5_008627 [Antrodia cinnamomea]